MADLKLTAVIDEAALDRRLEDLAPFFDGDATGIAIESTRLQPPICHWTTFRKVDRRVVLKIFFSGETYSSYVDQIQQYYPDRVGQPALDRGGVVMLPAINALLWAFPFDPSMPALYRCLDVEWVRSAIRRRAGDAALDVEITSYSPEVGARLTYRDRNRERIVAHGKASSDETCGLGYLVMNRLWQSPARERGDLCMARPLAFRPEAGLLLQAPVRGRTIGGDRNRGVFLDLVENAGRTLALLHTSEVPFGPEQDIEHVLGRLDVGLGDLALTEPRLYDTLRRLDDQIRTRAAQTRPGPPLPSHGEYKYDQLLKYRRRYVLADFESFCQAEAARDLGSFCAYLPPSIPRDWRESMAAETLRGAFLASYERAGGAEIDYRRVALYEAAYLGVRALGFVWAQQPGWALRASHMLDFAFERLVSPEPTAQETASRTVTLS